MIAVRRLYVYIISAVSLLVLAIGIGNLLELAFGLAWEALGGAETIIGDATDVRQEVSLYLALIAVSLPIWLLHWYLAARWAALDRDDTDRASAVRAIFFAAVLAVAAGTWASTLGTLVNASLDRVFDADSFFSDAAIASAGAIFIVAFVIWAYHAWMRDTDTQAMIMEGDGVWPPRLYVYGAALAGGVLLLVGVAQLLTLVVDVVADTGDVVSGDRWWASNIASGLSMVIVGGLIWTAHWYYSLHVLHAGDWRAASEHSSALRRAYLYLAVLVGVVVTLVMLSFALTELLRWAFGVEATGTADPLWARLVSPVLVALPFAVFWLLHQWVIRDEASQFADERRQVAVARLYSYVVSFLALAFTAVGLAYLLGVLIEFLFESARILDVDPEWVPEQISQFLSITLIGGAVWIWHWLRIQRAVATDPVDERGATSRRVYLYLVLAASTLATLAALAVVLYQALQIILGVRTTEGIASDVGTLIGIVIVAGALLVYHVLILRDDLGYETPREAAEPPDRPTEPAPVAATGEPEQPRTVPLLLTGPDRVDFDAVLADLRRSLPEGLNLRVDEAAVAPEAEEPASDDVPAERVSHELSDSGDGDDDPPPGRRIFR